MDRRVKQYELGGYDATLFQVELPSGKLTKNYWTSPLLIGKSTISMAIFNSFLFVYQAG